jgi:mycothiol system anti-sigma-R factor
MADCEKTLRELEAFLDGELTSEAKASIEQHLERCLDCLHAFDFHAELKMIIATKCRNDEMPAGLLSRIEECFGLPDLPDAPGPDVLSTDDSAG